MADSNGALSNRGAATVGVWVVRSSIVEKSPFHMLPQEVGSERKDCQKTETRPRKHRVEQ